MGELARFTFLSTGFWGVVVVAVAFALVFAIGPAQGKRAARLWIDLCLSLALLAGVAEVVWALESGEWRAFVVAYGAGPVIALAALVVVLVGVMWLIALRYVERLDR